MRHGLRCVHTAVRGADHSLNAMRNLAVLDPPPPHTHTPHTHTLGVTVSPPAHSIGSQMLTELSAEDRAILQVSRTFLGSLARCDGTP